VPVVHTPIRVASHRSRLIIKVGKISSLKISPKEPNLVKKYCEAGKITSLKTSPKETNLVKKYCEVGKITSMEKISPKKNNLVKNSSAWPRETPVRVGVFVIPTLSHEK
jgi:hypothetical protein